MRIYSMKNHNLSHRPEKHKKVHHFLPGPVKIKDGLFIGDQLAARDIEFIVSNKVTHVINTVSKHIPNLWERFGVHYLSVNWTEKEQNIFDKKNNAVNAIFQFIEQAMQHGESCLIHSLYGKSRACAVLVAYLMKKYSWSMHKSLQFTASKKENLQIRANFLKQLQDLQGRMIETIKLNSEWKNCRNDDQLTVVNTFVNATSQPHPNTIAHPEKRTKKRVTFDDKPTIHKFNHQTKISNNIKEIIHSPSKINKPSRSILKGDQPKLEQQAEDAFQSGEFASLENFNPKSAEKVINNINGNIVHVTVNNFITSDKKSERDKQSTYPRPHYSDQKQRDQEKKTNPPKKFILNDTGLLNTPSKSPYDIKLNNRNSSIRGAKQNPRDGKIGVHERPQSAKHRTPVTKTKEELINPYHKKNHIFVREEIFRRR